MLQGKRSFYFFCWALAQTVLEGRAPPLLISLFVSVSHLVTVTCGPLQWPSSELVPLAVQSHMLPASQTSMAAGEVGEETCQARRLWQLEKLAQNSIVMERMREETYHLKWCFSFEKNLEVFGLRRLLSLEKCGQRKSEGSPLFLVVIILFPSSLSFKGTRCIHYPIHFIGIWVEFRITIYIIIL